MGRELKRVPLDFDYPLNTVWYGYYDKEISFCHDRYPAGCIGCKAYAKIKGIEIEKLGCPKFHEFYGIQKNLSNKVEPPEGDGYQLWETTSEGSPVSPVFTTLDELCDWCEDNATTFGSYKATKDEWKRMLDNNFVYHKDGNTFFI